MTTTNWLIATDLDGTLLDDSYPYLDAARVVDEIQQNHPSTVALASSKTLTEMLELAQCAGHRPFLIFENGGGVSWPQGVLRQPGERRVNGYEVTLLGGDIADVLSALIQARAQHGFQFERFSELSDQRIADITHLPLDNVAPARQRLTSEPVLWQDTPERQQTFVEAMAAANLTVTQGGRFLHVGRGANKARAVKYLRRKICYERGERPRVLACGDAPNDLEMINSADLALLFPGRDGRYLHATDNKHAHAPKAGPSHWLQGVQHIFAIA